MPDSSIPPCHTGMPCDGAQVVQPDRFAESADAARLDVDDAAGAGGDRLAGNPHRLDRLVQADRRLQPPLQRRMIGHIVVVERLLDHHQAERVELRQMIGVVDRVRRIRVHHQRDRAEARAQRLDRVHVPSRLDLDLDPAIAGGELAFDLQRGDRRSSAGCRPTPRRRCDRARRRGRGRAARRAAGRTDPTRPFRPRPSPCCVRGWP